MKNVFCSFTWLSIGLLSIVSTQACITPEDPHGTYALLTGDGKDNIWSLRCDVGYAVADASKGVLKRCDGLGGFYEPVATACQAKSGCRKDQLEKLTGDDASRPHDCLQNETQDTMQEGSTCSAKCPPDYNLVGYFMCSDGEIIGETGCLPEGSLKVSQATGIASTYTMSLTNCNDGYDATSCAAILKLQIALTLDTRIVRVDVKDASGRYISSTSQSTFDAGTTTPAPGGRLLSSGVYDVKVEVAVFPQDAVGTQSYSDLTAEMMVHMQDLGTAGNHLRNTLIQKLASASPAINVQSLQVKVAPRQFATSIVTDKVRGTITSVDSLPAPVFPTTTAAKDGAPFEVPLWMVIALSAGAVIGACVVLSLLRCRRWRRERVCNS